VVDTETIAEEAPVSELLVPVKPIRRGARVPFSVWIALAWSAMIVLAAILAPLLPMPDPNTSDYENIAAPPMPGHPLGTDQLGRDMLSRLVWGAQASLQVGFVAVALGLTLGLALGLLAGYYRGWIDSVISVVVDIVLAFPSLIFIMVLVAIRGSSAPVLIVGLGAVMVPTFTRLARANTLVWTQRDFVTAATVLGSRRQRTLAREVFPNVLPSILAYAFVVVAVVMVAEGSLSFLGFGIQPPTASWGSMIAGGRTLLYTAPYIVLFPSLVLLLTVLSFNFIGDYLRGRTAGRTEVTL
jgi:peptide/nickel transport system permease protein